MLSKRFKYHAKSIMSLNELQSKMKEQIEKKIEKGMYSFVKVPCCVCEGRSFEILSETDRYGLYAPVVICKDCGLIQTNPRMTEESYNRFYNIEYRKLYVGKNFPTDTFFRTQYQKGKRIYEYLKESLGTDLINLKVLEIGAGAGGILHYFREKGNDVYGYDLDSEYVVFGRNKYDLNLHIGTIDDIHINWIPDIVIYSHVLEHILNPVKELIKLKSIVDLNSYIYIWLPGVKYLTDSYEMDFLKQIQNAHISYFTLTTLKNIFRKAGYDFVCGNEVIHSIFKPSLNFLNREINSEDDYKDVMSFLRRIEFYRFMPTAYNIRRLIMPVIIDFLKYVGLHDIIKRIYSKFKSYGKIM